MASEWKAAISFLGRRFTVVQYAPARVRVHDKPCAYRSLVASTLAGDSKIEPEENGQHLPKMFPSVHLASIMSGIGALGRR
jgi:hypothetical protein